MEGIYLRLTVKNDEGILNSVEHLLSFDEFNQVVEDKDKLQWFIKEKIKQIEKHITKTKNMEEIKISIEIIETEMQDITNKVDDFSRYGRSPNENDYLEIIKMLNNWANKRQQLLILKNVLAAIISNSNCL